MSRSIRRKLANKSLSERRRQCRKRTHMRIVHRSKQFATLGQVELEESAAVF